MFFFIKQFDVGLHKVAAGDEQTRRELIKTGYKEVSEKEFHSYPEPVQVQPQPTEMDRLTAQITYTAMKTGTLIPGGKA